MERSRNFNTACNFGTDQIFTLKMSNSCDKMSGSLSSNFWFKLMLIFTFGLFITRSDQFSTVTQSCPTFFTSWTAESQASLSITNSCSPPKPMSIELVMSSNHLVLGRPLLLLPSIFPSIRVFRAFCLEQLDKTTTKWASSYFIVSVGVIASKLLYIEIYIFTNYFSFF